MIFFAVFGILFAMAIPPVLAVRAMRIRVASWGWWIGFWVTILVGIAGSCGLSNVEYQTAPDFRWRGVPFPFVIFHLEGGNWIDYVTNTALVAPLNVSVVVLTLLLPFSIAACLRYGWFPRSPMRQRGFPLIMEGQDEKHHE